MADFLSQILGIGAQPQRAKQLDPLMMLAQGFNMGQASTGELPPAGQQPPAAVSDLPPGFEPDGSIITKGKNPEAIPLPAAALPQFKDTDPDMMDPAAVDINDPSMLDRRLQIFRAQEEQRRLAAQAEGKEYEPRTQESLEEFKAKPGLQFGTKGVMRDVIGNATDFLGMLVGRRPTYRKERFMDEIYGWDQPGQRDAAINRAMQYDPEMTMDFLKSVSGVENAEAITAINRESKLAMAKGRYLQAVSGLASGMTETAYKAGGRQALQGQLDLAYGENAPQLGEEYNQEQISLLANAGKGGREVSAEDRQEIDVALKRELAQNKEKLDRWKLTQTLETRRYVAQLQAETARGNAAAARELRFLMEENGLIETGSTEDFITGETTRTYDTRGNIRKNVASRKVRLPDGRRVRQYADGTTEPVE